MNRRLALAVAGLAAVLAGCTSSPGGSVVAPSPDITVTGQPATSQPVRSQPATEPAAPSPSARPLSASQQPSARHAATRYPVTWTLPDRRLSPGATQPGYGIKDICPHVNKALEAMRPSTAEKNRVYAAYGIYSHPAGKYEIDHVDAVELLGLVDAPASDPTLNLYPELNDTPDPVMLVKYGLNRAFVHNSKDILEDVLHEKVCAGAVPLATAQHAIDTDWRAAYARYVGKPPAVSRSVPPRPESSHSVPPPGRITSSAPAQSACHPRTSGGNCYRAGEFCRKSDLGTTGVAGNGERIRCAASGSRNRWELA